MKVSKTVVDRLNRYIPTLSSEVGGILGSSGNGIVDEVFVDLADTSGAKPCMYSPNTTYLNRKIEYWQDRNIDFVGIFHTHFGGACNLSDSDVRYISKIMYAMPPQIDSLYFPVFVLPEMKLVCYKASRANEIISIYSDDLIIE